MNGVALIAFDCQDGRILSTAARSESRTRRRSPGGASDWRMRWPVNVAIGRSIFWKCRCGIFRRWGRLTGLTPTSAGSCGGRREVQWQGLSSKLPHHGFPAPWYVHELRRHSSSTPRVRLSPATHRKRSKDYCPLPLSFILPIKSRFPSGAPLWRRMS